MAISRSDMSSFISHVLEKRYQIALRQLQSMLSTFEPKRHLLARKQASSMLCVIAAKCHNTMSKTPDEYDERSQLIQFLIDCFSVTGDAEEKLTLRIELLYLRQPKSAYLHSIAESNLGYWTPFGRDCVTLGYYGNGVQWGAISDFRGGQTDAKRRLVAEAKAGKYHSMKLKNSQTGM